MAEPDWTQRARILERIARIHLGWKRHLERELPAGLHLKQIAVLHALDRQGPLRPSAIAELTFSDRPTATSLIDILHRRGWITRKTDPADGRAKLILLTARGRTMLGSVPPLKNRGVGPAADPFTDLAAADLDHLERCLDRIVSALPSDEG